MARTPNADRTAVKTAKIQASVTPAEFEAIAVLARMRNVSTSKLVGELIKQVVAKNRAAIEDYLAHVPAATDLTVGDDKE